MSAQESPVKVRLFIFSGRPDPEWDLVEEAVRQLEDRVRVTLGGERADQAPFGGLGYRGFLVRNPSSMSDLPAEFMVFRRVLTVPARPEGESWQDRGQVEQF